ncbi:MAG: hypothetical protein MUF34_02220 [Polyangiaceae bacterium]|jgi:hypothetical protein|nr:hypothetical protein [Polyangiaceae bacterium]
MMRSPSFRTIAWILPLVGATACSKGPQDKLQGTWVGSGIENVPPDQEARAGGWVKATSFEFKGSKMTVNVPAESPRTGEFKVASAQGNRLTVQVSRPDGTADEAAFVLADENTLSWDIGNERVVKLRRAPKAAE